MQDVGEQQLLMLLLVIETDLEDAQHLGELRLLGLVDEPHDRLIDMRAIGRDLAVAPAASPVRAAGAHAAVRRRHSRS